MAVRPDGAHLVVQRVSDLPGTSVVPDEPLVALTFDDGPHERWTPAMLDALAVCQAPATFFVLGRQAADRPDLVTRMVREGHTVANHSWSHPRLASTSDDDVQQEVLRTDALLRELTGAPVRYFRPPYKKKDAPRYAARISGYDIVTVTWSVDPRDWDGGDATAITSNVLGALHAGAIVLLHDGGGDRAETVRAVPMIIEGARDLGYRFVAL